MVNRAILVGHLGRTPQLRQVGGQPYCLLSVATSTRWREKASDEWRQETEWHRVEVCGGLAERCAQYLTKGRLVYVEGRLETERWTDRASRLPRQRLKIVAHAVRFLGTQRAASPGSTRFSIMSESARLTELRRPEEPGGAPEPVPPPDGDSFEALPTI